MCSGRVMGESEDAETMDTPQPVVDVSQSRTSRHPISTEREGAEKKQADMNQLIGCLGEVMKKQDETIFRLESMVTPDATPLQKLGDRKEVQTFLATAPLKDAVPSTTFGRPSTSNGERTDVIQSRERQTNVTDKDGSVEHEEPLPIPKPPNSLIGRASSGRSRSLTSENPGHRRSMSDGGRRRADDIDGTDDIDGEEGG